MTWQALAAPPNELGESPFWHPDEQRLYAVDIQARQILRYDRHAGAVEHWAMPEEPGCIAPARSNGKPSGLIIAMRGGIYRARQWGGALQRLAPAPYDVTTTRFNDGRADSQGRFWAGTMYEPRDQPAAQLFSMEGRSGAAPVLELKAVEATIANGLAWSPDARTLYWSDTTAHLTRAWDWDAGANTLSRGRVFRQWPRKPPGWQFGMPGYGGRPDGAAVDVEGNYYAAMFEGARLVKLSPAGELLASIPVPAPCPTMPCFGGADLKTLYLTSARHGRPLAELQAWPQSGCVFSTRVPVAGLPVNFYED